MIDDIVIAPFFTFAVVCASPQAEIKVRCAAAKIEDGVKNIFALIRLKSVSLQCCNGIRSRFAHALSYSEFCHDLCIFQNRIRQRFFQTDLEALLDFFLYGLFIGGRERENIIQINAVPHIVDVQTEVVRI